MKVVVIILTFLLVLHTVQSALDCKLCEFYRTSTETSVSYDLSSSPSATELTWAEAIEDSSKLLTIPFTFNFFAGSYTQVAVNENGYLAFGELPSVYQNKVCPFDNKTTHRVIAGMWTDLIADGTTGGGHMHYESFTNCTIRNAAEQCMVFQWKNVVYDPSLATSGMWQIVIYASGDIVLQYQSIGTLLIYSVGIKSDVKAFDYFIAACNPSSAAAGVHAGTRLYFKYDALKDCVNGVCNTGENCVTCAGDCSRPCGLCGDGVCSNGETCSTCSVDCHDCCGDGVCSAGECGICPQDCTSLCCGDGICSSSINETSCSCPQDCTTTACCGDGTCSKELGETCLTCIKDCTPYCHINDPYKLSETTSGTWLAGVETGQPLSFANGTAALALLPFQMPFYNHFFDRIVVGSRGALWFGAGVSSPPTQQCPLKNIGTQYVIAPFWAGMQFVTSSSKVRYWNASNCLSTGVKCFAVQYDYMGIAGTTEPARLQVVLFANGIISFNYDLVPSTTKFTIGIKGGTTYNTLFGFNLYSCDAHGPLPVTGQTITFLYSGCGDGNCSSSETCVDCPSDCPRPCGLCGDGYCQNETETCGVCVADCGKAVGDSDNDGTPDCSDKCPYDTTKIDPGICGCGVPDKNTDGDALVDCKDACPTNPTKWLSPGVCGCQSEDKDSDGDGVLDCLDACPADKNKSASVGYCGCGNPETDTDHDGVPDCVDACINDPLKTVSKGFCGCGNNETDTDEDGTPDCVDECKYNPGKIDPGVCGCSVLDADTDGDGVPDCIDPCPTMANVTPTKCGCGIPLSGDKDNDGVPDCIDGCPFDPKKASTGFCGCGNLETDTDGDGMPDCVDKCPLDPKKNVTGQCGCGKPETDSDGDGYPDCVDQCPKDPNVWTNAIDTDGDGVPDCKDGCPNDATKTTDSDTDGDGTLDCADKCPLDARKIDPLFCGCGAVDPSSTAGLVQSPVGLTLGANRRDITCSGTNDGKVTVLAAGGTGIYQYTLQCTLPTSSTRRLTSSGMSGTSVVFSNLTVGACSLQVVDGNGCIVNWPSLFTFTSPTLMSIASEKADSGACNSGATFVVSISGGQAPHTFVMLGAGYSQTSGAFSGLPAGEYQCRVIDSRGCTVNGAVHHIEQWDSTKCAGSSIQNVWISLIAALLSIFATSFLI